MNGSIDTGFDTSMAGPGSGLKLNKMDSIQSDRRVGRRNVSDLIFVQICNHKGVISVYRTLYSAQLMRKLSQ